MAAYSKGKKESINYAAEVKKLRAEGPDRLYLLYGEEDYLREQFFAEIKKLCVEPESEEFNCRRSDLAELSAAELARMVDAMPFFAERTLVELRGFDVNKCKDSAAKEMLKILEDIPDYCTVVIIPPTGSAPDGRLAFFKALKKTGRVLEFTRQEGSALTNWIARRFSSMGKSIGRAECERLVFLSGGLMNGLIPEIEKIAQYCRGEAVSMADIDAVAHHIPEAVVFEMTELMARRDYDGAMAVLSELTQMKDEAPIMIVAVIGAQMRNLYAARLAIGEKLGQRYVQEITGRPPFVAEKLMNSARGFSTERLARAVEYCADCDYAMKSSSADDVELLRELALRLAADK